MVTKAFLLVLIIIAGLVAGPLWQGNPGYVLVQFGAWEVETSATFAAILLVLLLLAIWLVEALLRKVFRGGRQGRHWWQRRRAEKGTQLLQQGLEQLTLGQPKTAARTFERASQRLPEAGPAQLLAGFAWQQAGQPHKHLTSWHKVAPKSLVTQLLSVQQAADSTQVQQARTLLRDHPNHPGVLQVLAHVLPAQKEWELVRQILPQLADQQLMARTDIQVLARQAYRPLFAAARDPEHIQASWRALPRGQRHEPGVRLAYLDELLARELYQGAAQVAAKAVRKGWLLPADLLTLPLTQWAKADDLLASVREQVKQAPTATGWLTVLGALALATQNTELAERALYQVVQEQPSQQAWLLLGQAREAGNQPAAALSAYREAAALTA